MLKNLGRRRENIVDWRQRKLVLGRNSTDPVKTAGNKQDRVKGRKKKELTAKQSAQEQGR